MTWPAIKIEFTARSHWPTRGVYFFAKSVCESGKSWVAYSDSPEFYSGPPIMLKFFPRPKVASACAVLSCVAVIFCFTNSVRASCGDYLQHHGDQLRVPSSLGTTQSPAPCRGPHCRQAPERPPLPTPQRIVIVPTRDALGLLTSTCVMDQHSMWLVSESKQLFPSFCGLPLFRPPRV